MRRQQPCQGLQDLETRSARGMTSAAQRFRGKEATVCEPRTWSGEKGSESLTACKTELQDWVGPLRDNMMKVMELVELDSKNARVSQETVGDFKEMVRRLYQVPI